MLRKIKAALGLLQAGKRLDDGATITAKKFQLRSQQVSAFIVAACAALAAFADIDIQIDEATLDSMSVAIVGVLSAGWMLIQAVLTVVSTNKISFKGGVQDKR